MEYVFSTDPVIIVVEEDDEETYFPYAIFAEGEKVGYAHSRAEAHAVAAEAFESITGAPQEEGDFDLSG